MPIPRLLDYHLEIYIAYSVDGLRISVVFVSKANGADSDQQNGSDRCATAAG